MKGIGMITKEQYNACVERAKKNPDAVVWHCMETLEDGRDLCLVFGYRDGYIKDNDMIQTEIEGTVYTLCCKLAVNIDDLQCDYDIDWNMPYQNVETETNPVGDIWDTEWSVGDDSEVDYYNSSAKIMAEALNNGILAV